MRLYRHTTDLPAEACGSVVALGNFDGVHRGHRAVIGEAQRIAREFGAPSAVLTFEPHPRSLFRPDDPPFRLSPFRVKARHVEALGVDLLFVRHFDTAFSQTSARDFVEHELVAGLGIRHAVCGSDFVFGHGRTGDVAALTTLGAGFGFGVTAVEPVTDSDDGVYSSTRVRDALLRGDPRGAARLLGRPWEIEGRVEHGARLGRTIGFPTANVELADYLRPAFGVYAVRAGVDEGLSTLWHDGVANLGRRPTVGGLVERLEAHLFDFDGDLYDRHLRVQLLEFIRPERKFDGLDALKAQIKLDAEAAKRALAA
ncbi:bifunctional riboflavin kinase/FAD synthetase [Azospirillum sp. RWY-5-1]|uniref:Riboflavin biosynthesis protein n=1 Tax=Azospirillum oleiclasticum TaxID=2735135 RepID=A0ABX2THU0_9PROT|nr:bifunctional riboflavin kinase/FAD synthetase [Azospirillum oleiclasticum]NYZ16237.1 bifunctional riboflavin kinase/FAD synthetase [Azospirillum oleiclasticum]NYZ23724.1 bifunctional riboflavin kinase/FAD synthetase [Azospirillum oleiclasticum]